MDGTTIVGLIILAIAVGTLLTLTLLSRRRINRIARQKTTTVRALMRELKNGR